MRIINIINKLEEKKLGSKTQILKVKKAKEERNKIFRDINTDIKKTTQEIIDKLAVSFKNNEENVFILIDLKNFFRVKVAPPRYVRVSQNSVYLRVDFGKSWVKYSLKLFSDVYNPREKIYLATTTAEVV